MRPALYEIRKLQKLQPGGWDDGDLVIFLCGFIDSQQGAKQLATHIHEYVHGKLKE